ncbi:unnamed protein product, partial [Symbiodinium necroappetens]
VDLDSLTQAIEQLHLATGSLARAVRRSPASSSDGWVVVRSRFYVVLRNGRGGEPACYHSFASFKRDVGSLQGSDTVCHGKEEDGSEVPVDSPLQVLVVDFATSAASFLEPYDPVFPHGPQLVSLCKGWLRTKPADRLAFYTAPEEEEALLEELADQLGSISQLLPTITSQLKEISEKQRALEEKVEKRPAEPALAPHHRPFVFPTAKAGAGVSGVGALASQVGPPPTTRPAQAAMPALVEDAPQQDLLELGDPALEGQGDGSATSALTQQTQALTQLVAHLIQNFEGGADFGAARVCRASPRRAVQKGSAFLRSWPRRTALSCWLWRSRGYRRMFPSESVHRTLEEFRVEPRRFTFGQYVERYGGYGSQRELGLTMHMTTQIADVLLAGETEALLSLPFAPVAASREP